MRNVKTIVSLPAWAEAYNEGQVSSNKVADVQTAYAKVPLIFRAARIRANALQKIPTHFRRIGAEEDAEYPFETKLLDVIWRSELALCLAGGATWLQQRTQYEQMGFDVAQGLVWLNPFTVNLTWNNGTDRREFYQQIGNKRYPTQGVWTDDDIVFIREFHPTDDVGWGISPASVALGSSQLSFYLSRVASLFFEQGAMPLTIATIAGLSSNPEDENNKRVQGFFRRAMTSISSAFRVLAVGNDVKMQTTQAPLKDMVIPELKQQARKDVALAFEIPVTLLDDDANYATALEHKRGFYDETIIPRATMLAEELNRQWLSGLGFEIVFAPEEMDLYQEDEAARAASLGQLVSAINIDPTTARFAMRVLGYDLSEEQQAELDAMIAEKETRRDAMVQVAQTPPSESAVTREPPDVSAEQKSIERRQFKKFVESGRDASAFKFFRLDEQEQAALKAELLSEPAIKADEEGGRWVTINGAHVWIDDLSGEQFRISSRRPPMSMPDFVRAADTVAKEDRVVRRNEARAMRLATIVEVVTQGRLNQKQENVIMRLKPKQLRALADVAERQKVGNTFNATRDWLKEWAEKHSTYGKEWAVSQFNKSVEDEGARGAQAADPFPSTREIKAQTENGRWVTINGAHVFIGDDSEYVTSGESLGDVFHGGKKKVRKIDEEKLQSRDEGFYGSGFYLTQNKETASHYGGTITRGRIDKSARVLRSALTIDKASPKLVKAVKDDYIARAKSRGKEKEAIAEIAEWNHLDWKNAVDRYAERMGYDVIVHHSDEIVVKNPKVFKFVKSVFVPDLSLLDDAEARGAQADDPFLTTREVKAQTENGRWITTETGAHVFIEEGQSVEDAIGKLGDSHKPSVERAEHRQLIKRTSNEKESHLAAAKEIGDKIGVSPGVVSDIHKSWNDTTAHGKSLVIQMQVAKEFGINPNHYVVEAYQKEWRHEAALELLGDEFQRIKIKQEDFRAVVKETYHKTQQLLRQRGFLPDDEVTLYRGVKLKRDVELSDDTSIRVATNPLTSWSTSKDIARNFAGRGKSSQRDTAPAMLLSARVKVKDIYSVPDAGLGAFSEEEVVVIGRGKSMKVRAEHVYRSDFVY